MDREENRQPRHRKRLWVFCLAMLCLWISVAVYLFVFRRGPLVEEGVAGVTLCLIRPHSSDWEYYEVAEQHRMLRIVQTINNSRRRYGGYKAYVSGTVLVTYGDGTSIVVDVCYQGELLRINGRYWSPPVSLEELCAMGGWQIRADKTGFFTGLPGQGAETRPVFESFFNSRGEPLE